VSVCYSDRIAFESRATCRCDAPLVLKSSSNRSTALTPFEATISAVGRYEDLVNRIRSARRTPTSISTIFEVCFGISGSRRGPGSHFIFRRSGVEERINLQLDGRHAKPYQVRQVRAVILKYLLGGG
jgi:hypothetical protein